MITLYHCLHARSFRALWTLEELGLDYELKILPFPPRALRKDYLEINPLGTVPALFDGAVSMTESAAISQYLVSRYGPSPLDVGRDEPEFGAFLEWLHFGETTLTYPLTIVLRYSRLEPPERRLPQAVEDYGRGFFSRLRKVTAVVGERAFLCAGRFTAADISVGFSLLLAEYIGLGERFAEPIAAYSARLKERPAFLRAKERERAEAARSQPAPDGA